MYDQSTQKTHRDNKITLIKLLGLFTQRCTFPNKLSSRIEL